MAKSHDGRVAILTGGAGGLGRHFTRALAEAGCDVAIADIVDASGAVADVEAAGRRGYSEICDLSDAHAVRSFAQNVLDRFRRVDILVNNAAHLPLIPYEDLEIEQFRKYEAVNVEASLLLAQAVTPGMKERGYGRIVQIASSTLGTPMPGFLAYITTKAAGVGLVRALAAELGQYGITANALSPGLTRSAEAERNIPGEHFDAVRRQQLIKRTEEPEDLCGALLYLTSENIGFVTGQTINCDGGMNF